MLATSAISQRTTAPPPPPLASSRKQDPMTGTRGRSAAAMSPSSTESTMAAKRQQSASMANRPEPVSQPPAAEQRQRSSGITPPAPPALDNRRVVKDLRRGERTKAKDFINIANAGGERDLRHTKAREVQLKTRHGTQDGINLLHRTGSVTQLQLHPNESSVAAAKHHSKTTGQTFEVRARDMHGPAKRQLDKVVRRRDHRAD